MYIKEIIDCDFINYKKPCMTIMMPYCDFKCGEEYCQNSELVKAPIHNVTMDKISQIFIKNTLTEAICFMGLEPFESFNEIKVFLEYMRDVIAGATFFGFKYSVDIVIYTGYTKEELEKRGDLDELRAIGLENIIIKYGRYIPNQIPHYDEVLGVYLASNNQYAERLC